MTLNLRTCLVAYPITNPAEKKLR